MADKVRAIHETVSAVPTYILGPLTVRGNYAKGEYNIPVATVETTVVPSLNRGLKVTTLCGGIETTVTKDEMTRAPLLVADSDAIAREVKRYIETRAQAIIAVAESTTRYGRLTSLDTQVINNNIYLRIGMFTGDAAGHNMTTKAALEVSNHLIKAFQNRLRLETLSSNYCTDKKPARVNIEKGRGKSVEARVTVPRYILEEHLHTTPDRMVRLNRLKNVLGSELAGSLSQNAHHANIIASLYLATGQDIANVVDGSLGKTEIIASEGDMHFSITVPALIVGTIGGGTKLPYAKTHLESMGLYGSGNPSGSNARTLAEIIAAATLAGELSLMAALTNHGELIEAHLKHER